MGKAVARTTCILVYDHSCWHCIMRPLLYLYSLSVVHSKQTNILYTGGSASSGSEWPSSQAWAHRAFPLHSSLMKFSSTSYPLVLFVAMQPLRTWKFHWLPAHALQAVVLMLVDRATTVIRWRRLRHSRSGEQLAWEGDPQFGDSCPSIFMHVNEPSASSSPSTAK